MLEKGARVDAIDNKYRATPLHVDAYNGHIDAVQALLEIICRSFIAGWKW